MTWKPDKDAALKALIRETINAAGSLDPAALPHHIRARLKDQVKGDVDLDRLIDEALKERASRSR
ncbi:MAG: hypothetical protein R3C40_04900 [Parvularculaceae bacterium]